MSDNVYEPPIPDLSCRDGAARYPNELTDWWSKVVEKEYQHFREIIGAMVDEFLSSQKSAIDGLKHSNPIVRQAALFVLQHAFPTTEEIRKICNGILQSEKDEAVRVLALSYIDKFERDHPHKTIFWRLKRLFGY